MAIKVAYAVADDPQIGKILWVTGYDFYQKYQNWAHGSNRGYLAPGEPDNYYGEIMDFLNRKGLPELMESAFELKDDKTLNIILKKMAAAGYDPVQVTPPDFGSGPFEGFIS